MAGTAFADAGFGWAFTDGRGAMPMETDQITMEAESVSIVPDTLAPSPYSADMNVNCVFYLRTLTDQPLDVSVFFPFESLYDDNPRLRFSIGDMGFIRNEMTYDAAIKIMESEEGSSIPADSLVPEWLQFRASGWSMAVLNSLTPGMNTQESGSCLYALTRILFPYVTPEKLEINFPIAYCFTIRSGCTSSFR